MIRAIHEQTGRSVRRIAQTLGVPRSSHCHAAVPTPTAQAGEELGGRIETIFRTHRRRYGYRRIWRELQAGGHTCAPDRVRRLMSERGLHALAPRTHLPRTSDGRADAPSPNLPAGQALPLRLGAAAQAQRRVGRRHNIHSRERRLALPRRGH